LLLKKSRKLTAQVAVHAHPVAVGENGVLAHDAANPDDAPAAVLADDQRRVPELARLLQRTGLQVRAGVAVGGWVDVRGTFVVILTPDSIVSVRTYSRDSVSDSGGTEQKPSSLTQRHWSFKKIQSVRPHNYRKSFDSFDHIKTRHVKVIRLEILLPWNTRVRDTRECTYNYYFYSRERNAEDNVSRFAQGFTGSLLYSSTHQRCRQR